MGKADGLSRRLDWQEGIGKENKDRTLVKREWLETRAVEEVVIKGVDILVSQTSFGHISMNNGSFSTI